MQGQCLPKTYGQGTKSICYNILVGAFLHICVHILISIFGKEIQMILLTLLSSPSVLVWCVKKNTLLKGNLTLPLFSSKGRTVSTYLQLPLLLSQPFTLIVLRQVSGSLDK